MSEQSIADELADMDGLVAEVAYLRRRIVALIPALPIEMVVAFDDFCGAEYALKVRQMAIVNRAIARCEMGEVGEPTINVHLPEGFVTTITKPCLTESQRDHLCELAFDALRPTLKDQGQPVDIVTFGTELEYRGLLEFAGGHSGLAEWWQRAIGPTDSDG